MHQTIYRILRDTGRRPGEVVSLKVGCLEMIDGQHNLIYDNHKAGPVASTPAHHHRQRRTRHPHGSSSPRQLLTAPTPASGYSPPRCCAPTSPSVT